MKIRKNKMNFAITSGLLLVLAMSCQTSPIDGEPENQTVTPANEDPMQIVNLNARDTVGFSAIRKAFTENNPGYDVQYFQQVDHLPSRPAPRLAFLQTGGGTATIGVEASKVSVGDIVNLPADAEMTTDSLMDFLVFAVPEALPADIPLFIRPDWDPNITDTPGGCATETNAYRRILLTWEGKNGPYLYHALNAHRVRITNSFTHYHPMEGGFDEFYLVQMVRPGARIITSEAVARIIRPETVDREDIPGLLRETPLQVGDLVYLPRGVAHRGLDSVLAQVITVPGFIPGSEIGIDHHLKAISDRLSLEGDNRLPYHEQAAEGPMVK